MSKAQYYSVSESITLKAAAVELDCSLSLSLSIYLSPWHKSRKLTFERLTMRVVYCKYNFNRSRFERGFFRGKEATLLEEGKLKKDGTSLAIRFRWDADGKGKKFERERERRGQRGKSEEAEDGSGM